MKIAETKRDRSDSRVFGNQEMKSFISVPDAFYFP